MDRSREVRRSNMAAANGLPKRRQRSSSLRESHEDDGQMELQDTVRLRDRANKRDRDRDRDRERGSDRYRDREFSIHKIHNKRRRGDSLTQGNNREEETTEESVADEEDFEIEERKLSHTNSHDTTSFSPSLLTQNSRKSLPPNRPVRQAPALKAADELIGALVPRKARSASIKRAHENWVNGNGSFWEDHKASSSPATRSAEANSPSSSNVSVMKKMKPNGPKTRLPKVAKSSSSSVQQEDIEIEIAEVLYGLKKQSQNTKKEDDNIGKLESIDVKGIGQDTISSVSVLVQYNSAASDLMPDAPKKRKVEADNPSTSVQNGSITTAVKVKSETQGKQENCASKSEMTSKINMESCEASHEIDAPKLTSMNVEPREGVTKQAGSKPSINEESSCSGGPVTEKKSILAEEESATCLQMDSTVTKAASFVSETENRKEEKFKIDLMAPPPMVLSPERDGFNDFASDPSANDFKMKSLSKYEEKAQRSVKKEPAEEVEEKKIEPIGEKCQLKIDWEKSNQDNEGDSSVKPNQQSQKQQQPQPKSTIAKVEKAAQSSSVPLQLAAAGWPNGLPPMGYLPPFQTVLPMDGSTRPVTAKQPPSFMLSQPRPKRCATHCYIAHNIYLNQQVAKMNPFWPAGASSASASVAKPSNLSVMSSAENLLHGNPLQGSFPILNLNSGPDIGQVVANFPGLTQKDKSSEGINLMDSVQRKQLVAQPAPAANLLHGPAFIFPVSQQQAALTATANQPRPSKCTANATKSSSLSGNSMAAVPASSTPLPAVAAAVSYNCPNLRANEAPYFTILQSNGYSFPVPTPIGTSPAIRGGTHAQTLPFFSGSFYSSQIFHPSQLHHQQQPHSQPLMQAAHQNTSTSSGSSSSHKQLHGQQPRGVPVSGNDFLSSASMQSQQPQKQLSSNQNRKLEAEMSGENTPPVAGSRPAHIQTSVYGQNFSVPFQPLNFALMPSPAVGGGSTGGNHSEQQHQSQQKSLKGGVELIPQAFAMSFASIGASNSASNLNFSSMPLNPAIFQSLPDMAGQGYQVAPASQSVLQKNHQISEMKTGGGSSNHIENKKSGLGKSPAANAETLVFDDSARNLNFISSTVPGNWPSRSTTSTAITTNVPIATNSQNFQQQQLLQLKQQMLQQSTSAAARSKAPTSNSLPSSTITATLSNNASIFQQTLEQGNSSSQSPQWKSSTRNPTSQDRSTTPASSNNSTLKNASQQQVRSPQGHTQISFERHSKSSLAPHGQQIPTSNQSSSALVVGSPPSGGNLRTSSTSGKAGSSIPTLQSQQTENSSATTGQKSSPVCGRNVPSILSTCPSQLSELKY